jgi:putative tricarboxylic transport membrane protein
MNRAALPVAALALLVAAGAAALLVVAMQIHVRPIDVLWGPRLFPVAVMAALALTGVAVAASELLSRGDYSAVVDQPNDWKAVAFVLAGLALFGVLVEPLGFVIGAAALFVTVSRGFGSRRFLLDAGIGVLLGGAIYLLFAHVLGLYLPGGWLLSAVAGR